MQRLCIAVQGAVVGRSGERLQVRKDNVLVKDARTLELEEVLLMGHVSLTPDAVNYLLEREIDTFFLTQHGRYRGRLQGPSSKAVLLRRAQYAATAEPATALAVARRLIHQKLRFQAHVLRRGNRRRDPGLADAALGLRLLQEQLEGGAGATVSELMGLEGTGAAVYFRAYGSTLTQDLGFRHRARRPPPDPVNSLLSFGYTVLASTMSSVVRRVGLDPYLGFLHADEDGRESLVLDLMEPFRPLVVDVAVRTLLNRRVLRPADFQRTSSGGVALGPKGIAAIVTNYQARLEDRTEYGPRGESLELQRVMELYVRRLAQRLREGTAASLEPVPVNH